MSGKLNYSLDDISQKLVQIIQTRNLDKVRYWVQILEKQRDPMTTVKLCVMIRRRLQSIDVELNQWFQDVYCENFHPEVKSMWINFIDLCSLNP